MGLPDFKLPESWSKNKPINFNSKKKYANSFNKEMINQNRNSKKNYQPVNYGKPAKNN